jgi:hypothetical protein
MNSSSSKETSLLKYINFTHDCTCRYQIFWGGGGEEEEDEKNKTVVGLERGPLSLVSTTEELFDRKVAAPF